MSKKKLKINWVNCAIASLFAMPIMSFTSCGSTSTIKMNVYIDNNDKPFYSDIGFTSSLPIIIDLSKCFGQGKVFDKILVKYIANDKLPDTAISKESYDADLFNGLYTFDEKTSLLTIVSPYHYYGVFVTTKTSN